MGHDFRAAVGGFGIPIIIQVLYPHSILGQMGMGKRFIVCGTLSRSWIYNYCSLQSPQDNWTFELGGFGIVLVMVGGSVWTMLTTIFMRQRSGISFAR